jgi:hypothetical protein
MIYTKNSLRTMGLNARMPSPVAGRLIGSTVRSTTSIGVSTRCRGLVSLRDSSLSQHEFQDLFERGKSGSFAGLPIFAAVLRT